MLTQIFCSAIAAQKTSHILKRCAKSLAALGAKALGLTAIIYDDENIPTNLLSKQGRKLGDVIEYGGQRLVLIAYMPSVSYTAFVPAEEIQL